MWCLHDKVQSTARPRKLVELHIGIVLLLWSIIISIWFVFLRVVVKFTNCVLEKFKESKLFLNHSFQLVNIVLISFLKSNKLEWDIKMLVSSANNIGVDLSLINLGKSFMRRRKSRDPKMEPWGTPCITLAQVLVIAFPIWSYTSVLWYTWISNTEPQPILTAYFTS